MQPIGWTVLHPDLYRSPMLGEEEANQLASSLDGALVLPVVDIHPVEVDDVDLDDEFELEDGDDEYDADEEELAEALGMDIS